MLLAGDVGGTKTFLGLFRQENGRLRSVRERTFASQEQPSLEDMVRTFLGSRPARISACTVGVAGPISKGRSGIVNLPWQVDQRRLSKLLLTPHVRVVNDLEANAWGVSQLSPRQTESLTPGLRARPGNAAVIAAGTGLGMSILTWDGARHRPSASEGGHQSFAPRDQVEIGLLEFLQRRHGRVSIERVVSGPGIFNVYEFLVESGGGRRSPLMEERIASGDPNAAVTTAGMTGEDATAERALDLFVSAYGAASGDLALVAGAVGGVFVGGGIATHILRKLRSGAFLESFREKGRLRPVLEQIPVKVILEPRTALIGAAACAAHLRGKRGARA